MYTAGIYLSHVQGVEASMAGATVIFWIRHFRLMNRRTSLAFKSAGPLTKTPNAFGKIVVATHALATFVPPIAYVYGVASNSFFQPEWLEDLAFDDLWVTIGWKAAVRTLAIFAMFAAGRLCNSAVEHLGTQIAPIGIREKPQLVTTGPYASIRHPLYTGMLINSLACAVMYWSWLPIIGFCVQLPAFIIKIPIEEGLIEDDEQIGSQYKEYKNTIPYRLIPYVY